jgi:hypothetical protein
MGERDEGAGGVLRRRPRRVAPRQSSALARYGFRGFAVRPPPELVPLEPELVDPALVDPPLPELLGRDDVEEVVERSTAPSSRGCAVRVPPEEPVEYPLPFTARP